MAPALPQLSAGTIPGDTYLTQLSARIQRDATRLSQPPFPSRSRRPTPAPTSSLFGGGSSSRPGPAPLPLILTPQELFYLLLRFQAIGIAVGELDRRIEADARARVAVVGGANDRSETASFRSVAASVTGSLSSLGGWWGNSKIRDPDTELKLIYSALTKMPSLLLRAPTLGSPRILEMGVEASTPLDTALPLVIFKNLQSLELQGVPVAGLLLSGSYSLRGLIIKEVDPPLEDADENGGWLGVALLIPEGATDEESLLASARRRGAQQLALGGQTTRLRQPSSASAVMAAYLEEGEDSETTQSSTDRAAAANGTPSPTPAPTSVSGDAPAILPNQIRLVPKFPHLSHLALPALSLISFPALRLPSLVSLDLSKNLLVSLPPTFALLPNLRSLNLEGNMLASLRGAADVLPPVHLRVLNLDGNRIANLHGLADLSALERLSVRDNELDESLELSRLVPLTNLRELHVRPNPFEENSPAEDEWRVRLWEAYAREGRAEAECPKVDGENISWSERRRMRVPFRSQRSMPPPPPMAAQAAPSPAPAVVRHAHSRPPPPAPVGLKKPSGRSTSPADADVFGSSPIPGATTSSYSSARARASSGGQRSKSPPAKAAQAQTGPITTGASSSNATVSGGPLIVPTAPRRKRRQKRIVDLDGGAAGTGTEDSGTTDLSGLSEDDLQSPPSSKTAGGARRNNRHRREASARSVASSSAAGGMSKRTSLLMEATTKDIMVPTAKKALNDDSCSFASPVAATPPSSSPPPDVPDAQMTRHPTTITERSEPSVSSLSLGRASGSKLRHPPSSPSHSSLRVKKSSSEARRSRFSASVYEPSSSMLLETADPALIAAGSEDVESPEAFRRRLEAMRTEVGDSWLRVLSAGGQDTSTATTPPPLARGKEEERLLLPNESSAIWEEEESNKEQGGTESINAGVGEGVKVTRVEPRRKTGKGKKKGRAAV